MIFLFWGEIFVVFPAICGDSFGIENAAANNGLLYTANITLTTTGQRFSDGGTANLEGSTGNLQGIWQERFSSSNVVATPLCNPDSQTNQNQVGNNQGCENP